MLHCPRLPSRKITHLLLCCGAVFMAGLAPAAAADPTGDWRVADGVANIRVAECNGSMWGAVSWEKIPGGTDQNNPDVSKQSRPTLGMPVLLDMKKEPGGNQWKGLVYNAKDGKSYDTTITPVGNDQLKIQGCVLGFLCGGETWTRVAPPIASSPTNAARGTKSARAATPVPGASKAVPKAMPKSATAQKSAPGQTADIGDICLLPEIASPPPASR